MNSNQAKASSTVTLKIPHFGRDFSDDFEEIDSVHIEYWISAASLLSRTVLESDGIKYLISSDFLPAVNYLTSSFDEEIKFFSLLGTPELEKFLNEPREDKGLTLKFNVAVESTHSDEKIISPFHICESFLYDLFMIMNISAPGSCNLYNSIMEDDNEKSPETEISISSTWFDISLVYGRRGNWPKLKFVELDKVVKWYFSVRSGFSQIAKNRMEKVIFAILHLAKMDMAEPTSIIWMFYALETLFDTKAGENFRSLLSRICLLLSPDENHRTTLRKHLRKMYDLRSAFVHGGFEVLHPVRNEILDRGVLKSEDELSQLIDFGFSLVIAAVQEIIANGWREPAFEENLRGIQINPETF